MTHLFVSVIWAERFDARASRARWVEKGLNCRDPPRVHDGNVQSGELARLVPRAQCPGEPPTILRGVNAADLRKHVVRERCLDDDNRIREGFLTESIRMLDDAPEIGIVYGDRYDFGLRTAIERIAEFDLDALLNGNYIDACAVFRKQVWIDCQGFDPSMCPLDDWEFWVHAAKQGWRFHHLPRITFDYRVRPNSLIADIRSGATAESFRTRIRAKHSQLYWAKSVKDMLLPSTF